MPPTPPPTDPAEQLQWLVDREAIRNLISSFGMAVDDKDNATYLANLTEDVVVELPHGRMEGREAVRANMPDIPAGWSAQHMFGNIVIDLDGDRATTRAYLQATHIFDAVDRTKNAQAGGWYEHEVVRTPEGWRFAAVKLVILWEGEREMIPSGI